MTDDSRGASTAFSAAGDGEAMAERARDLAEQALHDLKGRAGEYVDASREKALAFTAGIERQIRERPAQSLAIAAGIGFALGLIYTKRS